MSEKEFAQTKKGVEELKGDKQAFRTLSLILAAMLLASWASSCDTQDRLANYHEQVKAIADKANSLGTAIDELKQESQRFDDGETDWKEITPKVKDLADEASELSEDVKTATQSLDEDMTPPEPEREDYPW